MAEHDILKTWEPAPGGWEHRVYDWALLWEEGLWCVIDPGGTKRFLDEDVHACQVVAEKLMSDETEGQGGPIPLADAFVELLLVLEEQAAYYASDENDEMVNDRTLRVLRERMDVSLRCCIDAWEPGLASDLWQDVAERLGALSTP